MKKIAQLVRLLLFQAVILSLCTSSSYAIDYEFRSKRLAEVGEIAANFGEISKGKVKESLVESRFSGFGPRVIVAAKIWASDSRLRGAPPAFRRYLFFEYLTRGTEIIAAASNHESLLINPQASVNVIFEGHSGIIQWAKKQMDKTVSKPQFFETDGYHVSVHPMVPSKKRAAKCIACHGSAEVNRPYPDGHKVLGYTFIAIPIN